MDPWSQLGTAWPFLSKPGSSSSKIFGMPNCYCCWVLLFFLSFSYQTFFKALPGQNYPRFGCALSNLWKCLSSGLSVTPTLCWNQNAFANFFSPPFKLYYGDTLSCVFKDRLSSANQWGTGCNALFCSAHPEKNADDCSRTKKWSKMEMIDESWEKATRGILQISWLQKNGG